MANLQMQARALGDPTRYRMFRYVADKGRPVDVAELTDEIGLNHNAIRQHLAKLVAAGLLHESAAASTGRGRPRLQYVVDPAAESRWAVVGPYERLAVLLAEVVRTGEAPVEVGRRAGRALGAVGPPGEHGPVAALVDAMARQGFEPEAEVHGDQVEITLRACPFAGVVLADPATVCELHLGLARGVAEAAEGLEVEGLTPTDPRAARCRLHCRLLPAE